MPSNHINKLSALKKLTPIIMLSHMRANTSLFGHILGNNPEINGYYEMHIGYYSWRSLIRQKLKFMENHKLKRGSRFVFDKVLHNEHHVNCDLLMKKKAKVIISLRSPNETIPSIIKLYQKINATHEFSTPEGAVQYYKKRIEMLKYYSIELKDKFIYVDANNIKEKTDESFIFIEHELGLKTPLSAEYKIQEMTGAKFAGDHSETLKNGKINREKSDYSGINIETNIMNELNSLYNQVRKEVITNSKS